MGTNFYWAKKTNECATCGRSDVEELHIGKSSSGWCFSLHVIPENDISDLDDWKRLFAVPGSTIRDEYGGILTPDEMLYRITERHRDGPQHAPWWYEQNHAAPGPLGLARHQIGNHCLGHGAGTWDLIPGSFS